MRAFSPIIVSIALVSVSTLAGAQSSHRQVLHDGFATRAELESLAASAEHAMASRSLPAKARDAQQATAFVVRQRLRDGDFQVGDRIAIVLDGAVKLNDTVTVLSDRTILLPDLPAISLAGVLRSELQTQLSAELRRFIRDPHLQTRPLVRVSVAGAVGRPGFYSVPADALLSDLITLAGGPNGHEDFGGSSIRRGSEVLWDGKSVATALRDGLTIDALFLQSGDQVTVGESRTINWLRVVQGAATVSGLASLIYTFARRR